MIELLWLLLPVAAASGWFAARRSLTNQTASVVPSFSTDYFKGLNYVLNEQPDKAIEVFVRMVEVDSDTVETHLALGSLFRRRGEVDRAIRIHQNLIARPTLGREHKAQALYELGEDYMKAGLFDRAETLFQELLNHDTYKKHALVQLLDIYQQESDWDKAIELSRRLEQVGGGNLAHVIAHYHCELAEKALHSGDDTRAMQEIKRAYAQDKDCVRASLLQGALLVARGEHKAAIKAYKRVVEQDIEFLPEILAPLKNCYRELDNDAAFREYLREVLKEYHGISLILALAESMQQHEGDRAAMDFLAEQLKKRPSVRGLKWLVQMDLDKSEGRTRENLQLLSDLMNKILKQRPIYECAVCGFSGKSIHWQCPGCKSWNSVKPLQGVDGE